MGHSVLKSSVLHRMAASRFHAPDQALCAFTGIWLGGLFKTLLHAMLVPSKRGEEGMEGV